MMSYRAGEEDDPGIPLMNLLFLCLPNWVERWRRSMLVLIVEKNVI